MAIMRDVAKLAGVSVSTVSFVLNGKAKEYKVADSTAKKVLQAAKQLGYKVNSSVMDLDATKIWQPTIGFFIPMNSARVDMSVIYSAINKHIKQMGRNYNILFCPYKAGYLIHKIEEVQASDYDSAVINIESQKDLEDLEAYPMSSPIVLYNNESAQYSSVMCMADEAITQAVKMIVSKGYDEIVILSGNDSLHLGDEYLNMFIKICADNGIILSEHAFITTENTMMGGTIAARNILNMRTKPELIVCMNTSLAFGAIPLLARNDFLIPRDAELFCFGSSGDADHITNYIPSLSMIAQPIDELTIKSFDIALHLADSEDLKPIQYKYSCDLLIHDSFSL